MSNIVTENLPIVIKNKLSVLQKEVEQIIVNSASIQQTSINSKISFEFEHSGPTDILTDDERAMSICFISRYEHLPTLNSIGLSEIDGNFYVDNLGEIRHVLNE